MSLILLPSLVCWGTIIAASLPGELQSQPHSDAILFSGNSNPQQALVHQHKLPPNIHQYYHLFLGGQDARDAKNGTFLLSAGVVSLAKGRWIRGQCSSLKAARNNNMGVTSDSPAGGINGYLRL